MTVNGIITNHFRNCRGISHPTDITAGRDGALWFINMGNNTVGRITTAGRVTAYHGKFGLGGGQPGITSGPDGAIWFTNPTTNTIGRITTAAAWLSSGG